VPKRFLEQIMLELKGRGWVESVPGRDGGFRLAVRPQAVTLGDVVRHFDGLLGPIGCVSTTQYEPCSQEAHCRFRRVLLDIRNYTVRYMDGADLATVFAGQPVTRDEVFADSFTDGGGI
jgi:Rrf2 family protein